MNRRVFSEIEGGNCWLRSKIARRKNGKIGSGWKRVGGEEGEMEGRVRETGPSKFFHFAEDTYTCFSLETSTSLDF